MALLTGDNRTALLDPTTKRVVATPGAIPLLRLQHKLKILEAVLAHDGVLLMNGPPVTRTFREAALRAGVGRVMAEKEDEQENMMLHTHLFTPIALTRDAGASYSFDLDARFSDTCAACSNESTAERESCLGRSIVDHLDYGVLPFVFTRMFRNGSAEPINERLFPIDIEAIGAGFVRGKDKLVTKLSGAQTVPAGIGSGAVEVSVYRWAQLVSRKRVAPVDCKVALQLGAGEVAIIEAPRAAALKTADPDARSDHQLPFSWYNYALYATDAPNVTAMDDSPVHSPSSKHANLMIAPDAKLLTEWHASSGVAGVLDLEKSLPFAHRIWTNSIRPPSKGWSCAPTPKSNGPEPRRVLCPQWKAAVADVVSAVVSARGAIEGVMIGDELVMGHFPLSNLTALAAALHDGLAPHGVFVWVR